LLSCQPPLAHREPTRQERQYAERIDVKFKLKPYVRVIRLTDGEITYHRNGKLWRVK
jgi:hypothetical protein